MIMKQWCVQFMDGSSRTLMGISEDYIRNKYKNVKCVFEMNRKFK